MCRLSKGLFAVFILLLPFLVAASAEYDERFPRICEYHLKKKNLDAHHLLAEQIYGRPFIFREFFAVRPEAIRKLGMGSIEAHRIDNLLMTLDCHENEIHPVVIQVQLFQSNSLQHLFSYRFPDATPTFWREIFLYNSEMHSGYHNVIKKHQMPDPISFDNVCSGFHTDPDVDGIRAYVSFH